MQKEPKWHQKGRSNTRQHLSKPKVGNIARSFLWGLVGTGTDGLPLDSVMLSPSVS